MTTTPFHALLCAATFAASLCVGPAQAQTAGPGSEPATEATFEAEAVVVQDYDVFVDLPTAFAFIKLPGRWKFIGKLDAEQLRRLPEGTLTSLLPHDAGSKHFAAEPPRIVARSVR